MAFSENLSVFISDKTPGHALAKIDDKTITCLYDNGFVGVDMLASSEPGVLCLDSDVSDVLESTYIEINGIIYQPAGAPEPDGTGLTLIRLRQRY